MFRPPVSRELFFCGISRLAAGTDEPERASRREKTYPRKNPPSLSKPWTPLPGPPDKECTLSGGTAIASCHCYEAIGLGSLVKISRNPHDVLTDIHFG